MGEHIPKASTDVFVANLNCSATRLLLLSWATPGQPGVGHINGMTHPAVHDMLQKFGWSYHPTASAALKHSASMPWFKKNVMVFGRGPESEPGASCDPRLYARHARGTAGHRTDAPTPGSPQRHPRSGGKTARPDQAARSAFVQVSSLISENLKMDDRLDPAVALALRSGLAQLEDSLALWNI